MAGYGLERFRGEPLAVAVVVGLLVVAAAVTFPQWALAGYHVTMEPVGQSEVDERHGDGFGETLEYGGLERSDRGPRLVPTRL